jgi:hypothetical protein
MDELERASQPQPLGRREPRKRLAEVVLVLFQVMLRLVQQLDLGRDDRNCRGGFEDQLLGRPGQPAVTP